MDTLFRDRYRVDSLPVLPMEAWSINKFTNKLFSIMSKNNNNFKAIRYFSRQVQINSNKIN